MNFKLSLTFAGVSRARTQAEMSDSLTAASFVLTDGAGRMEERAPASGSITSPKIWIG
jgi:hypothetical protein